MRRFSMFLFLFLFNCSECKTPILNEYDFIIVGAGSSGATVAYRLCEESNATVLLLEAGEEPSSLTDIPYLADLLYNTSQEWKYFSVPQTASFKGYVEQRCPYGRGKALGGSSTVNNMMYVRGNRKDYDNWASNGCPGWSYKDVLPYFLKSEDSDLPFMDGYHHKGGPLSVEFPPYKTPLIDTYFKAGREIGLKIMDYNGANQSGMERVQLTMKNGIRWDTNKAFIRPASVNRNIQIITQALVTKVLVDNKKVATAVLVEYKNQTLTIRARREIILSAGSFNTPQLLMLSGIGPKLQLQNVGIKTVVDLPGVGENLQDHATTVGFIYNINKSLSLMPARDINEENFGIFARQGMGPLTVPSGTEVMAFVSTQSMDKEQNYPDIQIVFKSLPSIFPDLKPKVEMVFVKAFETDGVTCSTILLRPKSRGYVKLRSSDPHDMPIINPQFLTEDEDVQTLVKGKRLVRKLFETKPFRDLGAKFAEPVIPGCESYPVWSEEYLTCYVRTLTASMAHPVGTCKMGNPQDKTTVVNPELKVKGVKGLRVVDASIIPFAISGNPNAPCIMIGEKAADLILSEYNLKS